MIAWNKRLTDQFEHTVLVMFVTNFIVYCGAADSNISIYRLFPIKSIAENTS